MMMGLDVVPVLQTAVTEVSRGDLCLPYPIVVTVVSGLVGAIIWERRRSAAKEDRLEERIDDILAKLVGRVTADEEHRSEVS